MAPFIQLWGYPMALPQLLKTTAIVGVMVFGIFAAGGAVYAQPEASIEASFRVNVAGRQRMLSQRITMAACFIQKGIDVERQRQVLSDTISLFTTSHSALVDGDAALGLSAEQKPSVLGALALVDSEFVQFLPRAENAVSAADLAAISELDLEGLEFLAVMNRAVNRIAVDYGESLEDLPLILSITIDVAGRQRMLSQKAAKEFCLIDSGIETAANRENLAYSVMLFTNTLNALINGYPGLVIAPPNPEILAQLNAVKTAWLVPSSVLSGVANGNEISDLDRRIIVSQMDKVLALMNQAVGMYQLGN